jgi:AcrR family transcriptional regulator
MRDNAGVSPRQADPKVREALLERAAHLVAERQPVTLRGLASDVGTSTMAIYTHFGSMDELLREVRREGFDRLGAHLAAVPATRDPVGDLVALGWAYCLSAVANPDMYRVMFLDTSADMDEAALGAATFLPAVASVERCLDAGRLTAGSPWDIAVEMWALAHGVVSLGIGGMLTVDELLRHLERSIHAALVGYGDDSRAAARSVRSARRRMQGDAPLPALTRKGATLAEATRQAADAARRRPSA